MSKIYMKIKNFLNDEKGATAIEYGLLIAIIGLSIVAGASTWGESLRDFFTTVAEQMSG